jgi:negative regulator of flagellin synthesis FlgM
MKINDSFKSKVDLGIDKASTEKTGAGKKSDALQTNTKAKIATDKAFDVEKVAAIKLAISSGQFKVSSEKVADGLIETVKDLLNTKKA